MARYWKRCERCKQRYAIPAEVNPQVCARCWDEMSKELRCVTHPPGMCNGNCSLPACQPRAAV